jgi:hypothetical protein
LDEARVHSRYCVEKGNAANVTGEQMASAREKIVSCQAINECFELRAD